MAVLSQIKIIFDGSFQCRLATDPDAPNSSFSDPFGDMGSTARGWTFNYNEPRMDRIIRFQSVLPLRSCLVDPFVPVKVTRIEVQPQPFFGVEAPWQVVPADPLLGVPVSLGDQAFFDTAAGGGVDAHEKILNCHMTIGDEVSVMPVSPPQLSGVQFIQEWENEYLLKKPLLLAPLLPTMDATRRKVLTHVVPIPPHDRVYIPFYAHKFSMRSAIAPVEADINFSLVFPAGILASVLLGWSWTLNMTFSRFDGDTLTGRMEGNLWGVHSFL